MKIVLPENIADITLSQLIRDEELKTKLANDEIDAKTYNKHKINLYSGIPFRKVEDVAHKDLQVVMLQIDKALNEDAPFVDRFTLNGVEYGFIPNFDNISEAEYIDATDYSGETEDLHKLMAVLFRPITKKSGKTYDIQKYKGTDKHAETMKQMPLNIVNGAISFFFLLSSELENYIQKSTREELRKEYKRQTILRSGVGMQL